MAEYPNKEYKQRSVLDIIEQAQKYSNSLSYNLGKSTSLLRLAESVDPTTRWSQYFTAQNRMVELSRNLPMYQLNVDKTKTIRDLVDSISNNISTFEALKLNTSLQPTFETAYLASKPPTQFIFPKGWDSGSNVSELNSVISRITNSIEQYNQLSKLESFKILSDLNNLSFKEVLNFDLTQEDVIELSSKSISEIDSDLSDEIKSEKDVSLYSDKAKKFLAYFYHIYLLQFALGLASGLAVYYILQAQEESKELSTQQEVKAFTRSSTTFDRKALEDYRFTMVNNLNLREKNSIDSNVLEILPIGTIVKIIDKSNRSWLLVEVEINGELEQGWVLRRYTTYFK